ncbi:hypothetical protein NEUTE1DRAFT_102057 [Neurospora tetrasperma FGSC 2508]|uniref:Uncharacterized protein n=1 Tax=Neurospora tetrasperma (strain FGSC 2508 / ATCC MYA-4615 / P0657) TaxID=510951 RepID=F8MR13_NEUT8|nr:uncharacterized protein NEUTE1DRAFT_102057 [Neurospora tetrasperma FGSC 2508]EGO56793.1 hypothetical protein NEUTE1DRAFT_102057 [Neurospora tetrasperma FGSC 2508]
MLAIGGCDYVIRNVHNIALKRAQTQLWRYQGPPCRLRCRVRKIFDFYWRPDLGKKGSQAGQVPTPAGARGYHRVANFILSPDLPYGTNIVQRLSYSGGSTITTTTTRTRHTKMERLQFKQQAPNSR